METVGNISASLNQYVSSWEQNYNNNIIRKIKWFQSFFFLSTAPFRGRQSDSSSNISQFLASSLVMPALFVFFFTTSTMYNFSSVCSNHYNTSSSSHKICIQLTLVFKCHRHEMLVFYGLKLSYLLKSELYKASEYFRILISIS